MKFELYHKSIMQKSTMKFVHFNEQKRPLRAIMSVCVAIKSPPHNVIKFEVIRIKKILLKH